MLPNDTTVQLRLICWQKEWEVVHFYKRTNLCALIIMVLIIEAIIIARSMCQVERSRREDENHLGREKGETLGKSEHLESIFQGTNLTCTTRSLCDLGQVTQPHQASVSLSVNWVHKYYLHHWIVEE